MESVKWVSFRIKRIVDHLQIRFYKRIILSIALGGTKSMIDIQCLQRVLAVSFSSLFKQPVFEISMFLFLFHSKFLFWDAATTSPPPHFLSSSSYLLPVDRHIYRLQSLRSRLTVCSSPSPCPHTLSSVVWVTEIWQNFTPSSDAC